MTGPDRNRKLSSVDGVVDDVRRIFNILGEEDLNIIYDERLNLLRNKYINGYCKDQQIKPGSIRKYLSSLKDFTHYLRYSKSHDISQTILSDAEFTLGKKGRY